MSYILESRDEQEYSNVKKLLDKAKKALHEACEMMEESESYSERNGMRGGYRDGYRDEDWNGEMGMRRGRNGRYSY